MAKEILNTSIENPSGGLFTDCNPADQPQGTRRFTLNGVIENKKITNEKGNSSCGNFPIGYVPIGNRYTQDGRNIVFLVSSNETYSQIGIVDKNCEYTTIVNSTKLGFKLNKQIEATYRLRRGCEDVIYFVDGHNSDRFFNFSTPEDYYSQPYSDFIEAGTAGTFSGEKWDANKFKLFPSYTVPNMGTMEVVAGGSTPSGTYNFALLYLDNNLNPTNYIYSSQLISIYKSNIDSAYNDIIGSSNIDADSLSGGLDVNKSIKIKLSELDKSYRYYKIAVIQATAGTGKVSKVVLSPPISINRDEFLYDGNLSGFSEVPVEEIGLSKIDIDSSEHIEQLENKLILFNVKGKQIEYCNFQKYASKINSNYIVKEVRAADAKEDGNPKSPNTYWERESYMGDDAYAMGVVYVFNDGLETPSMHIPGKSPGKYKNSDTGAIVPTDDQDILATWTNDIAPWYNEATYNALPVDKKLKKWQVYDTSVRYSSDVNTSYGAMGYHENKNAFYEDRDNCSGGDYWGVDACGLSLVGKPIRHHKFPSRFKEPHVRSGGIFEGKTGLYIDVAVKEDWITAKPKPFPTDPVNITIEYELDGSPETKTITFEADEMPVGKRLLDETDGDFSNIVITATSGSLTDNSFPDIFTYKVYVEEKSGQVIDDTIIRLFGIEFSNIEYPHPDIVGHYFVRGKRDDQNRTVLDKGFASQLRAKQIGPNKYVTFSYFQGDTNEQTKNNYLFTPRFQFNKEVLNGQYLKYENEFVRGSTYVGSREEDGVGSKIKEVNSVIEYRSLNYNTLNTANGNHNYKVNKSVVLDATNKDLNFEGPTTPVYNLSWSNRVHIINTDKIIPKSLNMPYVSYKVDRNVHPILDEIKYQRIHNSLLTISNSNKVYGGDVFISKWDIANSLFRKKEKGILKSLINILLIAAATVATVATAGITGPAIAAAIGAAAAAGISTAVVVTALVAGAIGVTANTIQAIISEIEDGDLEDLTNDSEFNNATGNGVRLSSYMAYANELNTGLYVESEVNVSLRQDEHHICGSFFRFQQTILDYFRSRWLYFDTDTEKWTAKGFCCPETYQYNKDFSRENEESVYFPLSSTYDCCSDCLESHPNRVTWSEESFQEELSDNYRVFKPNNYRDIESEHGGITGAIKRNNNLFVQTSEAIWMLPQSQQERITNEIVSFIGTGEFFSIPPKKILDAEIGTAGTQHKWSNLNIPAGLFYVDEINSSMYLYNQGFDQLTSPKYGMSDWFHEHLVDNFARQFEILTDVEFPNKNNPASPYGVGIHSTYDTQYNRIIVTKIDYLILADYITTFRTVKSVNNLMPTGLVNGQLVFDLTTNKFIRSNGNPNSYVIIELTNLSYFENKSWTMSFSLNDMKWSSWHSYIPNYFMYNHRDLYSCMAGNNNIWKHNKEGLFNSFYGTVKPYIYEYVVSAEAHTHIWEDLSILTDARRYNAASKQYVDQRLVTFNKLTAYNSRQSTGELKLTVKVDDNDFFSNQIENIAGEVIISRNERDWNINELRDYVIDPENPLFLRNWDAIKTNYFIDKMVNQNNINYSKDWNELESLRDKFLIIRLKFDNFTDVQLTTNYLLDTKGVSFR